MTLDEYQEKAMRTAMDFEQEEDALSYAAMAVAGEAGEYMNIREETGLPRPRSRGLKRTSYDR